jgi:hypothetical protein
MSVLKDLPTQTSLLPLRSHTTLNNRVFTPLICVSFISNAINNPDGLLIAAEHRYYGNTRPFGDNPTPEQLGWLSVEQTWVPNPQRFHPLTSTVYPGWLTMQS